MIQQMPIGQATDRAGVAFYPTSQYNPCWLGSLLGTGPLISASLHRPHQCWLKAEHRSMAAPSELPGHMRQSLDAACPALGAWCRHLRFWRMRGAPDPLLHDMHPLVCSWIIHSFPTLFLRRAPSCQSHSGL